jgi:hypothetical protein
MVMTMEKIQAYAFLPNLRRKLRLEIQQEKKCERLKKNSKEKRRSCYKKRDGVVQDEKKAKTKVNG